jgi:hypothetical protein
VVADFLVRMSLLEVDSANALGVLLVGDGVFGVTCVECVSPLLVRLSTMDIRHTSGGCNRRQMCVGASLCSISVANILYTLGFEHVPATCIRCDGLMLKI